MNFIADESVEKQIVDQLRADGHDVISVAEQRPGIDDDQVLTIAVGEQRILITVDKDFGELVFRLGRASSGVVLIRLAGISNALKAEHTSDAVRAHAAELPGAFTVIEPGRVRIRKP